MKRKQILGLLLCAALIFALLLEAPAQAAGGIWSGNAGQPPGVGTIQSPYQISTGEHLKWYANHVNSGNPGGYAVLTANIMLNDTSNWENWETNPPVNVWTPIGNAEKKFNGTFDGMGYTISGIYINSTDSYQGLFGYLSSEGTNVVKNVKVARSYIKGQQYVGGICGYMNFFSAISGCEIGATVVGENGNTGGITGITVKNSTLTNCRNTGSVTGKDCTGGITGYNNGTVSGCVNQGTVSGSGSWIGGLIGMNYSTLSRSYNNGNVSASGNYVGGVCGSNQINGAITDVYNSGSVTGGWPVCGNTTTGSSLTNVYYLGSSLNNGIGNNAGTGTPVNKSAEQFASGEVAYLMGAAYGQTLESGGDLLPVFRTSDDSNAVYRLTYMNGTAVHTAQYYNAGAAVSSDDITPPIMDDEVFSHWDGLPDIMPAQDVTVTANSAPIPPQITTASPLPSGTARNAYSAKIEAAGTKPIAFRLLSGDLSTGLTLDETTGEITGTPTEAGSSTVTIRAQNDQGYDDKEFSINITDEMPGSGTSADPYKIWTADHLIGFADKVNSSTGTRFYAVLMADIALNDTDNWQHWETSAPDHTWTPIGISSTYNFKGGFDGNHHTISGIYINSSENNQGLFGFISAATTVKNLNLVESYIKGNENVGGICGTLMNLCKIDNCRSAAAVRGAKYVGGLCGSVNVNNASILNCSNEGTVTGSNSAGGIVGFNSGTISGCKNRGTVQGSIGSIGIGGICGNSSGAVTNVYNTGNISGGHNTGGICGVLNGITTQTAALAGAYNWGNIAGSSNKAAICGLTNSYCQLSDCYYLDSSSASGIGYNPDNLTTVSKSGEQFASGEVAYLLGTAFGQTLNTDTYPVFRSSDGSNAVYRLLYMNETQQHAAQYYNTGNTVSAAGISAPSKSGHYFSHWEGLPSTMPAEDAAVSAVFLAITVPSAPQSLIATPGDGQVILSWTAPADSGGSASIEYEVSKDNGTNWTDADSATGHTFTGLTNGQSYVFGVRAINEAGAGAEATTSATPQAQAVTVTSLTVQTAPSKTIYTEGDALDLSGLVVTLHKSNDTTEDVPMADFETRGITVSPANGTILSASDTSVTIIYTANSLSVSQSITVNPAAVSDAAISPDTGSFDKYAPDDVQTTITWCSATGVTDIKAEGVTIGPGSYTVSGNTLTIKKEYLAAQSTGSLVLTVEFNAGASAALTIDISDSTPPTISPALRNYDLNAPADVTTVITWNSAASVTDVVYGANPLVWDTDYTIDGNDLTVKDSYLSGLSLTTGATLDFVISFDTGDTTTLTVNVVDGHVPSSNADLSSLFVNGTPVSGFDPNVTEYYVELPYGSISAAVTAAVDDSLASCVITDAAVLPGSATVTVTAEDGTTRTYTINFTIEAAPFIAVTNITGVPATATVGTPLTLTGTVVPANATNRAIIWSIQIAGTTGAAVSGNTLSAAAAGTVVVRATITNGASESMDYTQDFDITVTTVPVTTCTITASAGRGGSISPSGAVSVASGGSQTFAITPDSGYRINAVTVDGADEGAVTTYTFTNVTADHTINATFTRTSSGGGGGGGAATTPPTTAVRSYKAVVKAGNDTETTLPVTVDKDAGTASVNAGSQGFDEDGTVITIPAIPDVNTYTVGISIPELSTSDVRGTLTLAADVGSVTVPSNMLTGVAGISGSKAEISIGKGNRDNLPADLKAAIGNRPLIELSLTLDGEPVRWNNPNAPVTISIPYEPTVEELADPESIIIWYIDGDGQAVCVPNGHYDPATGTVTFTTTHFSRYAVAYNPVSFSDVPAISWYADAVSFIAARDISSGTSTGQFSPGAKLTRAEFIVMLMKAYAIAPDANPANNFSDAGSTWYTNYLAAAKRLSITAGVGNNQYAPGQEITRQEMFTLLCNTLKIIGQLPAGNSGKTLSDFSDAGQIAPWAKDSMELLVETGVAGGSGGKLDPAEVTTRAEMAQVLYNLLGK